MTWIEIGKIPNTPRWLLEFAPHLREGEVIRPSILKTPSGQLWNRTPDSVRTMLKEYADWTLDNRLPEQRGLRSLEDIMVDMELRK